MNLLKNESRPTRSYLLPKCRGFQTDHCAVVKFILLNASEVLKDDLLPRCVCNICCDKLDFIYDFQQQCKEIQEKLSKALSAVSSEWSSFVSQSPQKSGNSPLPQYLLSDADVMPHLNASVPGHCDTELTQASTDFFAEISKAIDEADVLPESLFLGDVSSGIHTQDDSLSELANLLHFQAGGLGHTDVASTESSDRCSIQLGEPLELLQNGEIDASILAEDITIDENSPAQEPCTEINTITDISSPSPQINLSTFLNMGKDTQNVEEDMSLNSVASYPSVSTSDEISTQWFGREENEKSIAAADKESQTRGEPINVLISNIQPRIVRVRVTPSLLVKQEVEKLSLNEFRCRICGRTFRWKHQCEHYVRDHIGDKQFHCMCGKSYSTMYALKRHAIIHDSSLSFLCQQCGRRFKTSNNLQTHEKMHNMPAFECNECGKAFQYKQSLMFHMQGHLGNFEHVCDICGCTYVKKRDLNLHMKRHRGEKPHQCPTCGKSFLKKANMQRHSLLHIKDAIRKGS
ncbi:zinc finger and SCAN domain-containing protein 2-like isoform X1 [Periplaneta americana]|uniref:zinc finger and SCAN domain-containing protein 2-like isoform X1 n=1 Tax=Periplaneta americana TaxID=6978 RepID=UPI0037E8F517